jgi:pimeloyl-ACP methyl ester carboxylesterase
VFASIMEQVITRRTGLSVDALDYVKQASSITHPTLLFHGAQDELTPVASSDAFARARPDLLTYQRVNDAGHTASWNADSQAYEAALTSFLVCTLGLASQDMRTI